MTRVISISYACNVLWKGKAHKGTDLGCHSFGSLAHVTQGLPENKLCRPYQEVALLPLGIPGGAERFVASSLEDFERLCQLLVKENLKKKKKSSESSNYLYKVGIMSVVGN